MRMLIVKTCDGDLYYRGTTKASRNRAAETGAQQVCVNDLVRWSEEDRCRVRTQAECRDTQGLFDVLLDIGCLRWVELQE